MIYRGREGSTGVRIKDRGLGLGLQSWEKNSYKLLKINTLFTRILAEGVISVAIPCMFGHDGCFSLV